MYTDPILPGSLHPDYNELRQNSSISCILDNGNIKVFADATTHYHVAFQEESQELNRKTGWFTYSIENQEWMKKIKDGEIKTSYPHDLDDCDG